LTAKIEALESSGDGRILAMPNLLCRSGGEAKFFAGGEIPIKISTLRTSQVEWKKYGIMLHVQPRADRLGRLKFQLSTEISSLDGANKVDTVPGILTNKIDTQFNLKGTQTVVLSGLIKKEESKAVSGVALLNSIPILGRLFESHDFNQNLTELLVFVTPEVYFPNATSEGENEFN
jgi:pilus assembly protein CpaC